MKTTFYSLLVVGLTLITSCSTERYGVESNSIQDLKTTAMKEYDQAFKNLTKVNYRSSKEEFKRLGSKINDRSLIMLYNASKQFLLHYDIHVQETENKEQMNQTINQANALYLSKLKELRTQL